MITKKVRRHSGRVYPRTTMDMKKEDMLNECLEPQDYYDNWFDYRDGYRDFLNDGTKKKKMSLIRMWETFDYEMTQKLKKIRWKILNQLRIRKIRKGMQHD